jgi:hypothetical protein
MYLLFLPFTSKKCISPEISDEERGMTQATLDELKGENVRPSGAKQISKWWILATLVTVALLIGIGIFLERAWPFTQANVVEQLQQASSSKVHVSSFKKVFFPRPGCIAQGVILERGTNSQDRTRMTIDQLVIEGNLTGLFSKHVALIRAQGAHAFFPPFGSAPSWKPTTSEVIVDQLIANGASLEFARRDPGASPLVFAVREFVAHHLASHDPMQFEVRIENPIPPGEVYATGTFGPWNLNRVSATLLFGNYSFRNADLGAFKGIHGTLASDGQFRGTLENISVIGTTEVPAFGVDGSNHKAGLNTKFGVTVDPSNGDVTLEDVHAQLLRTTVFSRGKVASPPNQKGKTANLDFAVRDGRIQDLLLLFVSEKHSPLNGTVSLKAKTIVPPGNKPFLQKLRMTGDFGIESALFTKEETQENLDKLSAAARGRADQTDDPENVVSDLQGHVIVQNGVATFSDLRFRVPGARARLNGTFDLITQKIDMRGLLFMDANLPKATSGIKSFLLRAIDPFLKKNRRGGARIPVSIKGTYQKPSYSADPV